MSELINNLQQIYNAKLSIKAAIGTQSDELADYASYINALKPNGYTYLTENGSYNISAYEYAYVNVTGGVEVEGYAYITTNGDHNISTYEMVNVEVPIDWNEVKTAGYIVPSGIKNINANGNVKVAGEYWAYVNVPIDWDVIEQGYGYILPAGTYNITENGTFNISSYENTYVNVSSSIPEGYVLPSGTITCDSNGENYDVRQYAYAYIDVEGRETIDPYKENVNVADMIIDEFTEADYVVSTIMSDFRTSGVASSFWCETVTIDTGEVDGNNEPIMEEKKVLFKILTDGTSIRTALEDYPDLYGFIYPIIQNATLSVATGADAEDGYDYLLEGELYLWNMNDMYDPVVEITENGFYPIADSFSLGFNVNVEGSEPESYTLEGGLFINGQGQYYIADEGDLADYINIIPKEDVTGTWNDRFSYLTVGKDTTITGYDYYNGDAFAIQAESYTQSTSIAYQTARLTNIEPYLIKQYYGLGKYYDSAYITVNRSFNFPNGTQLGIPREVFGYYFPNSSYTNRYENLMVDVSYIVPAGDDILGLQATAMAFGNTTYALDLQNIRYCDDYMVYDNTYVTATTGIDGTTYYEIDLTQSGNYGDSDLVYSSILSGGAFFADMPNGTDDNNPIVHKLEVPGGTFVFNEANWVLLSNNEENTTGSVVFNKDHNNDPTLQIDTSSVWWMDENGNWNITGVGELTVNGINSLKIRFYVDSSDNTWKYDWLIDVDYEFNPDAGSEEEEPEE